MFGFILIFIYWFTIFTPDSFVNKFYKLKFKLLTQ